MGEILTELCAEYDHIIIDSAPIMPVSDTLALSKHVEGVIMIVGRTTPRHMVRRACLRISDSGAKILGVVMNQLSSYGHSSYYPYSGYNYSHYYSNSDEPSRRAPKDDDYRDLVFE
jgi:Mrp family chromosome partitioning ATPase